LKGSPWLRKLVVRSSMRKPIRILYAHNGADLYGASRSLARLLKGLDRERYHPLVVLPEEGPLKEALEEDGVEVLVHSHLSVMTRTVFSSWRVGLFGGRLPGDVWRLRNLIRSRSIDLVHTNTGVIISPALAARLAGIPHIWHVRDWFQEFAPVWKFYAAYITRFSRRVIAVSEAVASQFPRRDRVQVIHNGFALEEFAGPNEEWASGFRAQYGLGNAFVAGCVGRIKLVRKGQEVLARAAGLLKRRGVGARYVVVGSPFPGNEDHLERLKQIIEEERVAEEFVFTGELADARPAYAAMDVMVLPSAQPEPFGGVVMEAMAMGVPVIASAIGGSVDQVAEGVTGFLVEPGSVEMLADRIEKLKRAPGLRAQMSAAGPQRIQENFSMHRMLGKLTGVYEEVLGRSGAGGGGLPV
jgi:glycosyltransferase involved in cell wall biosynthesis